MLLRILCLFALISVIAARNYDSGVQYGRDNCPHGFFRLKVSNNKYFRYTKNCYRFGTERTTWHVARLRCQEQGGYLANIRSQEESDAITNYLTKTLPLSLQDGDHDYWISVQDIAREGYFKEDTTNTLVTTPTNRSVTFTNWESDEPNQSGPNTSDPAAADCVRLNNEDRDGGTDLKWGWADWDCNVASFFYLCEARPGVPFRCNTEY